MASNIPPADGPQPGEDHGSRLRFLRPLGAGGMAEVLLARLEGGFGIERFVAVKRVLPQFAQSREYAEMLWAEARASAPLVHPNLVQTYEVGVEQGRAYVVMEYVHGPDLKRLIKELARQRTALPLAHALRIAAEAAAGLHAAHTHVDPLGTPHPVVHCDVSPHNILVSLDGAIKLTDFGIAQPRGRARHQSGGVKGKVSYLSPEAACGLPVDARSDVFSLGVVLFELLTGVLPFKGEHDTDTLGAILRAPAPHPSRLGPHVPADVAELVLRALRRDPGQRTPSAAVLHDELEAAMARHGLISSPRAVASYFRTVLGGSLADFLREAPCVEAPLTASAEAGLKEGAGVRSTPAREGGEGDETVELLPCNTAPDAEPFLLTTRA